jgi:shikimate kinase
MGCGKTTFAEQLSETGFLHLSIDLLIASHYGNIADIFENEGEAKFRVVESIMLHEILERAAKLKRKKDYIESDLLVIDCGGGIFESAKNYIIMRKYGGQVIFIDTPFDVCYERIANDPNRPNAILRTKDELRELYDRRRSVYQLYADKTISLSNSHIIQFNKQ